MERFVTYTRVSTKKQGESGLGLEAQDRDIALFFDSYTEIPFEVIKEFRDVESGTNSGRPELKRAIDLAMKEGATLLVAKLDRLSRKVSEIASLMEDKRLKLRVAQMPHADKFQLHIYAALAEQERDFISKRTKAALKSAKDRGVKLGGQRPEAARRHAAIKAEADANAARVREFILRCRKSGHTYRQIANELNKLDVRTARGGQWHAAQIRRYEQRVQSGQHPPSASIAN